MEDKINETLVGNTSLENNTPLEEKEVATNDGSKEEKLLTQTQVNEIVQKRVANEKSKKENLEKILEQERLEKDRLINEKDSKIKEIESKFHENQKFINEIKLEREVSKIKEVATKNGLDISDLEFSSENVSKIKQMFDEEGNLIWNGDAISRAFPEIKNSTTIDHKTVVEKKNSSKDLLSDNPDELFELRQKNKISEEEYGQKLKEIYNKRKGISNV